ncbi:MAG: hypothetical protein R2851_28055 [Caldilineaceae bacterium]
MQAAAAPLLWLQQIGMLAAGLGLLGYHHHVLQTDGDYGSETGSASFGVGSSWPWRDWPAWSC